MRRKIRRTTKLDNTSSDTVSVILLVLRMDCEFRGNGFGAQSNRREMMHLVAQDTYKLGGKRVIEQFDHLFDIALITGGMCSLQHILASILADGGNIDLKMFTCRG